MNRQVSNTDKGDATYKSEVFSLSRSQYVEQFQQMGCRELPRRTEVSFSLSVSYSCCGTPPLPLRISRQRRLGCCRQRARQTHNAYPNSIDMKEIHKLWPKKSDFYLTQWQNNKAVMLAFFFLFSKCKYVKMSSNEFGLPLSLPPKKKKICKTWHNEL